jgi:hypothetical protein
MTPDPSPWRDVLCPLADPPHYARHWAGVATICSVCGYDLSAAEIEDRLVDQLAAWQAAHAGLLAGTHEDAARVVALAGYLYRRQVGPRVVSELATTWARVRLPRLGSVGVAAALRQAAATAGRIAA